MRHSCLVRWIVAVALCAGPEIPPADAASVEPITVAARAVPLGLQNGEQERVGKLLFRGGVALSAGDRRFGGWSDLDISEDGARLTAVSDRGFWLEAAVVYSADGRLEGLDHARLGTLMNLAGRPQRGTVGDAEGLARAPDGGFWVTYERRHRIWLYPAAEPPFSARPRVVPPPAGLERLPENGGLEAIVRLPGGRLLTLAEEAMEDGAHVGWIGDGRAWRRLSYEAAPDFNPTGITRLPDGDILVLERRFTKLGVPGARIARVPAGLIRPGARLVGDEVARIEPPLALDNFEGIAARLGPNGATLIYVLSDDNFFFLQRTLLLMFELDGE